MKYIAEIATLSPSKDPFVHGIVIASRSACVGCSLNSVTGIDDCRTADLGEPMRNTGAECLTTIQSGDIVSSVKADVSAF
ncbi:MAG: hypothetical protein R2681_03840 [Pyrinomonadaceae bacterium]